MRRALIFLTLTLFLPASLASAQSPPVAVTSPQAGQAVQGVVTVNGTSAADGFLSAEISFAYSGDATGTWFLVAASGQPVTDGTLAVWDTTAITDGTYTLRLRVTLADGSYLDALVPDLRVRNYTPTETPIPPTPSITPSPTRTPVLPTATATLVPSATPLPTPTALAENPAILPSSDIYVSVLYGGLTVTLLFLLLALYVRLRRK
jgi:hypothetical protein